MSRIFSSSEVSGASTESMKASISSGSFHDAALNWLSRSFPAIIVARQLSIGGQIRLFICPCRRPPHLWRRRPGAYIDPVPTEPLYVALGDSTAVGVGAESGGGYPDRGPTARAGRPDRHRQHPRSGAGAGGRAGRATIDLRAAHRAVQRCVGRAHVGSCRRPAAVKHRRFRLKPPLKCGHSCCVRLGEGTQEEMAMRLLKNWFPIALAVLWIAMAAMAIVDFASFAATTRPQKVVAAPERPLHSAAITSHGRRALRHATPN